MWNKVRVVRPALLTALLIASITVHAKGAISKLTECPAKTFEGFLEKFAEEVELQKKYTKVPLALMDYEDQKEKGRVEVEKMLTKFDDIKDRLMDNKVESNKSGIKLWRIEDTQSKRKIAVYAKDSTGITIYYYFKKEGACWVLMRIENWST